MQQAGYSSVKLYFQAAMHHQETALQEKVPDLLRKLARRVHRAASPVAFDFLVVLVFVQPRGATDTLVHPLCRHLAPLTALGADGLFPRNSGGTTAKQYWVASGPHRFWGGHPPGYRPGGRRPQVWRPRRPGNAAVLSLAIERYR